MTQARTSVAVEYIVQLSNSEANHLQCACNGVESSTLPVFGIELLILKDYKHCFINRPISIY